MGKLIYLTVTRPDLSFAVSQISQFMHAPKTCHLKIIDKVLRYLKGTPGKGILMKNNKSNELCCYTDVDWAGSFDTKFTINFCTFVDENIITWKNKKNIIARSSAEAKYRAMATTISELMWIT
jgi:hypothetical protein